MNDNQRYLIQQIYADLRVPGLFRSGNQQVRQLLAALALSNGYDGDPAFADDYGGADALAELMGRDALPILKLLKKKVGGSVMEDAVDRAVRKHGLG